MATGDQSDSAHAPSPLGAGGAKMERAAPPGFIHLGVAKEIYSVLTELGWDAEIVVAEAGLDPRLFDRAESLVSIGALGRLLALCVEKTGIRHFGLMVGRRSTLASLRMVGALMRHSATVGDAVIAMNRHLRIQNRGVVTQVDVHGDVAIFSYSIYDQSRIGIPQIIDGGLATATSLFRELCGSGFKLNEVLIPHRSPADPEPYRLFFQAPIRFNQEGAALVFSAGYLSRAVEGADPFVRRALELQIAGCESTCPPDLKDELRRLLRIELLKSKITSSDVARRFLIHRRTLNRHLKANGTGFQDVVDDIRFGLACQLLEDTDLRLIEISAALDFSEPAAFTRAFHRWSGFSPSDWRNQAAARALEAAHVSRSRSLGT